MAKQDEYIRSQVRFPPELYEKLKRHAAAGGSSLNAEIIHRLETSFNLEEEFKTELQYIPKTVAWVIERVEKTQGEIEHLRDRLEELESSRK